MTLPSSSAAIRVVNTFIDVASSDDEEDSAHVSPIKTEPARVSFAGLGDSELDAPEPVQKEMEPRTLPKVARDVPCLLGQPQLSEYSVKVTVKNTFIEIAEDGEGEDDNPVTFNKIKSEPVLPTPLSPEGEMWRRAFRSLPTQQEEEGEHHLGQGSSEPLAASLGVVIVPLGQRQPETSVGSAFHGTDCKPCSWFWRPQGCFNSQDCAHCHLCLPGELKRLKKAKQQAMRAKARNQEEVAPC
eukprot:symbB.v1.2.007545.t1/scaffold464.1/size201063/14